MKTFSAFVFVLLLGVSSSALAASFERANLRELQNMGAVKLGNAIKDLVQASEQADSEQYSFGVSAYRITQKDSAERIEQTLKQLTYIRYRDFSRPDDVRVERVARSRQAAQGAIDFLTESLSWDDSSPVEDFESAEPTSYLLETGVRVFKLSHSNSFGFANELVLYYPAQELLVALSWTYGE